jgi:hypothetical protein
MKRPDDNALLEVLHERLGWQGNSIVRRELLSRLLSQAIVERLRISDGQSVPPSIVVKALPMDYHSEDAAVPLHAEATIHQILLTANAPLPAILWHGWDSDRLWYLVFFEDVTLRAELGQWDHHWSEEEMNAVMRAIAKFHGAGHGLVREVEKQCRWISARPPVCIDGTWIQHLLSRVPDLSVRPITSDELRPLERVCERYDIWKKKMQPYDTVAHCDIHTDNVAVRQPASGEKVGSPQFDVEYCSQRDWQTDCRWDNLRERYRHELTTLCPEFACEDEIWQWGYRLGLLQLMLWGNFWMLPIAEAGDQAPEDKKARLARSGGLCGDEFLKTCQLVVQEDPGC